MPEIYLLPDSEYEWPGSEDDEEPDDEADEEDEAASDVAVIVVSDGEGSPGERALPELGDRSHELDTAFYLLQTDCWVERNLVGDTLHVDFIVWAQVLEQVGVDVSGFTERSELDADAVRVLRATATVDPDLYARAPETTLLFYASAGTPLSEVLARYTDGEDAPLVWAPAPDPDELREMLEADDDY